MKKNVLLIVLPYAKELNLSPAFPYGLLSIATYNKDRANIHVIDCDVTDGYMSVIFEEMQNFRPDIIGFTMMFDNSYQHLEDILQTVRSINPEVLTLLGGAAATLSYKEILEEQLHLDAICYSEGEIPFQRLLESNCLRTHLDNNPSWITRQSLLDGQEPTISYIDNLDEVIDIDYSFLNPTVYDSRESFSPFATHVKKHNRFYLVTSRGCPMKCSFCCNPKLHGKKMRFAGVDKIIDHVKYLIDHYGMDILVIYDDQLLIDMPRAKDLFRKLTPLNLRVECPNGLSPMFIDVEMAHLMKSAGMDTVYLAVEHGSEYVLKYIMRKPIKLRMVKPVIETLREVGMFIHGFFVMGMPGETREHREETRQFITDMEFDWSGLQMATPFRGSELYDMCVTNGWIPDHSINKLLATKGMMIDTIINIPGINNKELNKEVYAINLDVNFHNNRRMRIGDYETAARCFEEVLRRYPEHAWAKHYLEKARGLNNQIGG